ncbi:lytic transglycosylase domain-containing protein [Sulfobacillus thermosulfidooxidans]|uniref:lytic transglycosylase domain-containing protein n=1 Tax=Sulfobacillus thermosulfidooxidans TaxID=28034 RepID=UPI00096BCA09|nr:lytic transglycosylase domain-containing protein [Sulfobacillus thermosulfidooxidans]OLZ10562.1 hypothetical protein BFX05_01655 [Sulfobacillus thermosulfidooxidans]OLZ16799.1 hypothetical protein BFX06_14390 [Sulfobacillus thermosulfidooxidans]OLZ22239.1 hypothetical protein BFX07_10270 [Sulfobacillus thermosulfidooxidans]
MAQRKRYRLKAGRAGIFWISFTLLVLIMLYRYVAPMPYRAVIWHEAQVNHLSPYLVAAVIRVESSYRPNAVSSKGAIGLMQLIPSTAKWASLKADNRRIQTAELFDPALNIHLGTWYLNQLLQSYAGNEVLGLAAYNAGSRNVRNWLSEGLLTPSATSAQKIPFPETKHFVHRVLFYKVLYHSLYGFFPPPSRHSSLWQALLP